ncbi:MAG TPA: magnesium transporter [Thermoanaerobaculaceae bacterium]|nr:magnesium transporter [Thermoanaerobaculaceae bacterium]
MSTRGHFDEPVLEHARHDFPLLEAGLSVGEALEAVRREGLAERIVYFYVVDENDRLVGVLPVRRLLTADPGKKLSEIMISRVVAVPATATVLEACELFAMHRFLALPVVDEERRMVAVVDISLFTDEVFDLAERQEVDDLFETIGFRISALRSASVAGAFRLRFPWLLVTITGGTVCALVAGAFQTTLAESLVLAFFLTLVLGLGESVAAQSIALTIQALHGGRPTLRWYARAFRRELATGLMLGAGCGALVASLVGLWESRAALAVGSSVALSLVGASFLGLTVPSVLHALRLDPKVAAGPVALALADILTVLLYLVTGTVLIGNT